jgi:hypothetical protein
MAVPSAIIMCLVQYIIAIATAAHGVAAAGISGRASWAAS